ncbi:retrovirus-related Pol polyprotein from transposon opus [Trichonephila clavipes]|nr:retrovirus-related Pol polyprotein from transposon opus [Trichonephila clavipes]
MIFSKLLNDFPNIVKPPCANQIVKHNVVHYIDTFGPPVCAKPRRIAPDRLKIVKMEFQHMLDLGHMRPSSSNYSSPLHMVPKKESNDGRPVGDFRSLNAQTKKNKYPIPSILDFTSDLHGANIFSHIDLVKAFHQIRIASEDIHKTAICTPFGLFESTRMPFGIPGVWPEVIPTEDMLAETTARALLNGWISRFGTPVEITTGQGTNFESSLMREFTNMMGSHRIHSASYHPQSNGMIERFHRHFKSAIIAHEDAGWTDILPIVLLGLR